MMKNRHLLLLLVSGLAVAVAPACGDPEDPATNNAPNNAANNKNNPNNDPNNKPDECGAGKVKAAYNGGAEKCYTSCPGGSECAAPQVCKDADGASAKICVDGIGPLTCPTGEVKASYQGGAEQCYKTCTDDASCGDAMKVCKAADGGGAKVCVAKPDEPMGPCLPDERFNGQIGGTRATDGGTYATTDASYAEDAGLEAIYNYFVTNKDELMALDKAESMAPKKDDDLNEALKVFGDGELLTVTNAVVTAVTFSTNDPSFYLQDKKRAMLVFRPFNTRGGMPLHYTNQNGEKTPLPAKFKLKDGTETTFKVGQRVSFKVRAVNMYQGLPQISLIEDVEILEPDGEIYVQEMSGKDIVLSEQWGEIIKIGGRLTAVERPDCGAGNRCFTFAHGENEDKTITLRTKSDLLTENQLNACVTFVGPLGSFPSILGDNPKIQIDQTNFSWARGPFVERN